MAVRVAVFMAVRVAVFMAVFVFAAMCMAVFTVVFMFAGVLAVTVMKILVLFQAVYFYRYVRSCYSAFLDFFRTYMHAGQSQGVHFGDKSVRMGMEL